jgi:hypothetical protein
MEMLPPVLDVFNYDALVMELLVTVFLFAAFDDGQNLFVGQPFIFHRIDTDMVQRLGGFGATGYHPHVMKCFVKVLGFRVADFNDARLLIQTLVFEIIGGCPVAATDVALYYQISPSLPSAKACRTAM